MSRTHAQSENATRARALLESLQATFVDLLQSLADERGSGERFERIEWLRDEGRHGGGQRYALAETALFNGASVNVSGVHYDDDPDRRLRSADALSTIIHPAHPLAPSVHLHFSWTEMRDGSGYWRMMADLNPAIERPAATERFARRLREAAPDLYEEAAAQGDKYFYIPALERHRGATHFYLEKFSSGSFADDAALAERLCRTAMEGYVEIVGESLEGAGQPSEEERAKQLAYHTLYLFQVLTLDRGTTSGLLVHDQNDVGIMGSIPAYVDRELLASWASRVPSPQDELVRALVDALEAGAPSHVTAAARKRLAQAVRGHFRAHPQALELQASGNVVPPTVENHRAKNGR